MVHCFANDVRRKLDQIPIVQIYISFPGVFKIGFNFVEVKII